MLLSLRSQYESSSSSRLWIPDTDLTTPAAKLAYALDNSATRVAGGDISTANSTFTWRNRGVDSGDFSQTQSSLQPTYSATGLAVGSGKPAVSFSGGQILDSLCTLNANTVSVFAILSLTSGNNGKRAVSLNKNTADFADSQSAAILKSSGNTAGVAEIERSGFTTLTGTDQITSPCLVNTGFDGTNGFIGFNGNTPVTGAGTGLLAPTHIMLGGYFYGNGDTPVDFWTGPISEVIVLYYSPSTADRQSIEGYLAWKWGIQAGLPAGHPYKNAAPVVVTAGATIIRRRTAMLIAS